MAANPPDRSPAPGRPVRPTPLLVRFAPLLLSAILLGGCGRSAPEPGPDRVLGGITVPAAVLEEGRTGYERWCRGCHGTTGAGDGPVGWNMTPRPRDLTRPHFKFGSVASGQLPTDDDYVRVIRRGLTGTGMLPWPIEEGKILPIVQYVKSLSPAWQTGRAGTPITTTADPWTGRLPAAVERGKLVYHGVARCWSCHPSQLNEDEVIAAIRAARGSVDPAALRPGLEAGMETASVYGPLVAPDLRTANFRAGAAPEDLYRTLAAGIGGTAMPSWKGTLPEDDLWALVHYIRSLPARR